MEVPADEMRIADQLKNCCDQSGTETDLAKSAQAIHSLALFYRHRSPDKLSLIKCVGLLNAAIARKPSNKSQIRSDLIEVCQHILQLSGAKTQSVNLVEKAQHVKTSIQELRKEVDNLLQKPEANQISSTVGRELLHSLETNNILSIEKINQVAADEYTAIMADLCQYCQTVMGMLPCEYALAGMGSLARKEITPYSDFEHMLLMEEQEDYETRLEYFRWLSVIFHVVVLNLQETIIPSLNIQSLNDSQTDGGNWFFDAYTPRGVSFDGMMVHACKFPLGRLQETEKKPFSTELIKPVSEMLKYLSSEEELKNGYHLSDILTKTCFVFGNAEVYEQFETGVKRILNQKSKDERIEEVKQQVKEDLNQYSTRFRIANFASYDTINIKQLVYRSSTLFLTALGRINNLSGNSCFDIISEMERRCIISQNTKHKLSYAVAIACEMRLRVYLSNQSQRDNAFDLKQEREKNLEKFLKIVGKRSTINYFQIVYCLQCLLAQQLKFTKLHFYSNPQLINLAICLAFKLHSSIPDLTKDKLNIAWNRSKFDFDACLEKMENRIECEQTVDLQRAEINQISLFAEHLYSSGLYDEALELHQQILKIYQNKQLAEEKDRGVAKALSNIGEDLYRVNRGHESLPYLHKALEIYEAAPNGVDNDPDVAITLRTIGKCLTSCFHRYDESLSYLKRSLKITQRISADEERDLEIATLLYVIGNCMKLSAHYDDALTYFRKSLEIYQITSIDEETDRKVARVLNNIGTCLEYVHRCDESVIYQRRSLAIYLKTTVAEERDRHLAVMFHNIGVYLQRLHQYEDSMSYLQRSLTIKQNVTLDEERDPKIAQTLHDIGNCLIEQCEYDKAMGYLQKALGIYQNISFNKKEDDKIASVLHSIAKCS